MNLAELCRGAGIYCPESVADVEICSVTSNSERVQKGSLFVCLRGHSTDGNLYAERARARGAAAVLSDSDPNAELKSQDAHLSLALLCRELYKSHLKGLRLVGVTGTNGKTSVTAMIRAIFTAASVPASSVGTLGYIFPDGRLEDDGEHMTTPDTEVLYSTLARMAEQGTRYAVCEVSSHALAQKRVDGLHFDVGIFTNVTRDHLDFHKTEEEYFLAKKRLAALSDCVLVNGDDTRLAAIDGALRCSCHRSADFMATDVELYGDRGCGYRFLSEKSSFTVISPIPGRFNVMNTLEAAACAELLGVDPYFIKQGLATMRAVSGRMERVELEGADFSVYIDYAHTPDAMDKLLLTAKGLSRGRVVVLFGCGGDRDRGKRAKMAKSATRLADLTVMTSDNSRSEPPSQIFSDMISGVDASGRYVLIPDRKQAIAHALSNLQAGDVLILAGKGHEKYEIDADGAHPFDEAEVVRQAYKSLIQK